MAAQGQSGLHGRSDHIQKCCKGDSSIQEASRASQGGFIIGMRMKAACPLSQVCNHPDLFEGRPIVSAFDMVGGLSAQLPSMAMRASDGTVWDRIDLAQLNLLPMANEAMSRWEAQEVQVRCGSLLYQSLTCSSSTACAYFFVQELWYLC